MWKNEWNSSRKLTQKVYSSSQVWEASHLKLSKLSLGMAITTQPASTRLDPNGSDFTRLAVGLGF